ncbi:MAG TPA: hypothetical protein VF921_14915 [Vicinamibacterales bacterium]
MTRGTFQFEVTASGDLVDREANVEALRKLWLDRSMIDGDDLGPGDEGDFDHGAWHVACHLIGAGGVRRAADGRVLWLEVSHDAARDGYFGSVTAAGAPATHPIDSAAGRALLNGSTLLGFVEGNSVGHISARTAHDPPTRFNKWQRQNFNQPVTSDQDGGKVWEHWCTVRDIRPNHAIAGSVLRAYVSVVAALGDRFVPAVARGRRDYGHPTQLCAMVLAGLTSEASATWDVRPDPIPDAAERQFLEATPRDEAMAAAMLAWDRPPRYYMFARRIRSWSPAPTVREDLLAFQGV